MGYVLHRARTKDEGDAKIKGVKELKIKKIQENRELKTMAMDTSAMTAERQEYFAEEVACIMKVMKQRVVPVLAMPMLTQEERFSCSSICRHIMVAKHVHGRACVGCAYVDWRSYLAVLCVSR